MLTQEELKQLVGTRCGKLLVVEYLGYYKSKEARCRHYYKCVCDCGKVVEVERTHLNPNSKKVTESCGCSRIIHGYTKTNIYSHYKGMMSRVKKPDQYRHKHYIENNIKVCPEWDGHPDAFCKWAEENGYAEGLTLDRIDSYGDYSPENCRWVSSQVQANNRPSYNHNLEYNGKTQSITAWSRELGIPTGTLYSRLNRGMSVAEAFTTPINKKFSPHKYKDLT